jgi:CMP/dCMP kinase
MSPDEPAAPPDPGAVDVITIDGPTASGKGTVAEGVAAMLDFHVLDSGALYRLVAMLALDRGVGPTDADRLAELARSMAPHFGGGRIEVDGRDVSARLRTEAVSQMSSQVAVHAPVRAALMQAQRDFRRLPGLVADGRDMGSVVFPDAGCKVFLTAALEARAQRRHNQLIEKGISSSMSALLQDLRSRDERDQSRATAPLRPAADAYLIDSSTLTPGQVIDRIVSRYRDLKERDLKAKAQDSKSS